MKIQEVQTLGREAAGLSGRHIAAATIGNALEFYDFLIYALFAIQIGHAFFPVSTAYGSLMLSLATFGAGFATRPLGGIVLGRYADRAGRRPAMLLCLTLIGVSITAMALIPSYDRIGIAAPILAVIARLVEGFSLGGEVGSNTAFLAEAAPPRRRGEAVSWQIASQLAALIAGNLVGIALTAFLPQAALDAYGWRIALLVGAAAVPVGLWMRNRLPETLHSPDYVSEYALPGPQASLERETPARAAADVEPSGGSQALLTRRHYRVVALGLAVIAAMTVGNYVSTYIVTYAQHTLHLTARAGFMAEFATYCVSLPLCVLGGRWSDRYGRRPVNIWSNLAFLVAIYPVFAWIVAAPSAGSLVAGMMLLGALSSIAPGCFLAGLAEALPRAVRSTGFGTTYAVAIALFGGTTQLVVTWLIHVTGSPIAPAWYLIAATAVGEIALLLFPETAPVRLLARSSPLAGVSPEWPA